VSQAHSGERLAAADPAIFAELVHAHTSYVVPSTQYNYGRLAEQYAAFCRARGLQPWPVDQFKLGGWVIRLMTRVKPSSLKVYLAAVRYVHINHGFVWELTGCEFMRRVLRYVKRTFPAGEKGMKLPITRHVLRRILPLLPGWPRVSAMSFEDLCFACASVVAVCGFLRGGEFLFSPGQARPILLWEHVQVQTVDGGDALVVAIPQPKAEWWRRTSRVPVFSAGADDLCPVRLWRALCSRSPCVGRGANGVTGRGLPAFHGPRGQPLTQKQMVQRTLELVQRAGITMVDDRGRELKVMAASWRAGGVRSASEAGLEEATIRELGRWHSSAWTNYLLFTDRDLSGASARMWRHAATPQSARMRVDAERVEPGPSLACEDTNVVEEELGFDDAGVARARACTWRVGMRVQVPGQQWGEATITRDNEDGSFNVVWDTDPRRAFSIEGTALERV
jgi:hypothetical protein